MPTFIRKALKNKFPITAGEVVMIGLGSARLTAFEAAYRTEVAMRRTGSYHLVNQQYNTLSGGEKQRVSIARCLCQNAGIFLLDEPTSFLDQQGKEDLLALLHEINHNEVPTMVIVSHEQQWIERLNLKSMGYAIATGATDVRVLTPYEMIHPSEYELRPDDIAHLANASIVIYAGYEIMMGQIKTGLEIPNEKLLQIHTSYNLDEMEASVMQNANYLVLLNFPGMHGTRTIQDVIAYNTRQLAKLSY